MISLGEPSFRTKQIFQWLYKYAYSFEDMTNISKPLRAKLSECAYIGRMEIEKKYISRIDETRRYLLKLEDGNFIEAVLMKYKHGYTICISTQVGCAMGCTFCASTKAGKVRNLSTGELIEQILVIQEDLESRISNVVMMGIGEPLDNFENVMKFLENVNNEHGLNIGHRHICLSTCGVVDKIYALAEKELQITLSISLHATDDEERSKIMPINKKYNIESLLKACRNYTEKTSRRISFEYTLIDGVNDSEKNARELANLVYGMLCHVNLIPVNRVKETDYRASGTERIERFRKILEDSNITATVRREMGSDISAACGQLRRTRME
ncbi:MAG: 23S rRNA (adenine(2503)-C(2))-methyltransferase RlmN [Oscillospiraceae bacterium]